MMKSKKYTDYIKRTFLRYALLIIGVIFCLYLASLIITYETIVVHKTNQENETLQQMLQEDLEAYENEAKEMLQLDVIRSAFHHSDFVHQASERLYDFRQERTLKGNFVLMNGKGKIITTNLYERNAAQVENSFFAEKAKSQMATGKAIHQRVSGLKLEHGQSSRYFFAHPVFGQDKIIGYLFFFIEENQDLQLAKGEKMLITDRFDNILNSSDPLLISSMGKANVETDGEQNLVKVDGERYYMKMADIMDGEFKVATMTSIQVFVQFTLFGIGSLIVISAVLSLLLYAVSPASMKEGVQSFNQLLNFITDPDGKREEQLFDEFKQIEQEFSAKLQQINELIEHNKEIEEIKRKMEIKQLESQFNPHFAFNVLEMLRYEITLNPKNAQDIIVSFAKLLRYNTYYGNTVIELGTDLDYVQDYLKLQKMRFHERLDYKIEVSEDLKEMEVPKLILQPLIENSIKHNMEKVRRLFISMEIKKVSDELHISIEDDGCGVPVDKLLALQANLKNEENALQHYGLYHTQRVIQLLYGKPYGLEIQSGEGSGLTVTAILPLRKEVQHA